MDDGSEIQFVNAARDIVSTWGLAADDDSGHTVADDPEFAGRPLRLGVGAKYIAHNQVRLLPLMLRRAETRLHDGH